MKDDRLIRFLLGERRTDNLLFLVAGAAFLLMFDLALALGAAFLIGPWLVLSLIALTSGGGLYAALTLSRRRRIRLLEALEEGRYDEDTFREYLGSLTAAVLMILPGGLSFIAGAALTIPALSRRVGGYVSGRLGFDWRRTWEYLNVLRYGDDPD